MTNQFLAILYYYRNFALSSFGINLLLLITNSSNLGYVLITKLFLTFILLFIVSNTDKTKGSYLYKKLNISNFKLFGLLYAIDAIISICFFSLINPFL